MRSRKAFTLIELLIVVAIIAILAAIAVPNFLEAQVRSKVSRCKADMRSLATAIEAYRTDGNAYPMIVAPNSAFALTGSGAINGPSVFYQGTLGVSSRFVWLTTPIQYITSVFQDPFINSSVRFALDATTGLAIPEYDCYDYVDARSLFTGGILGGQRGWAACSGASWSVVGAGPDKVNAYGGGQSNYGVEIRRKGVDYDATNGTVSWGDIVRVGGSPGPRAGTLTPTIDRINNIYYAVPN